MEVTVGVKAAKRLEIVLCVEKGMLSCAEGAKRLGATRRNNSRDYFWFSAFQRIAEKMRL